MKIFVWILLFVCGTATAQEIVPVTPDWKRSFGMRDNTSRDTLTHAARDRDGNIILAGGTEKDTTFSDIVVRKLSPDGALLWEYRYSTTRGVGYDLPLNLFVSRFDEVYLVGYARSAYYHQHAGLYAFKLGKDGTLVWDREITACTLPDEWFGLADYDSFLDDESNLYVTYNRHAGLTQINTTHIQAYDPDGTLVRHDSVVGLGQSADWDSYTVNTSHDLDGNFVYTVWVADNNPGYYYRRINPKVMTDEISEVSLTFLPDTALTLFHYYFYGTPVRVYHGFNGHSYIVANFGLFGPDRVLVLDVDAAGYARYLYVSPKDGALECNNILYSGNNTLLISGVDRSVPGMPTGFILELDDLGQLAGSRQISNPGGFVPYGLVQADDKYLMSGAVPQSGGAVVKAISVAGLQELWSHEISPPQGEIYAGNNAIVIEQEKVVLAGTFRSKKFPQMIPYTEHRWFTESFNPVTGETYWQDNFNGDSTSHANYLHHLTDRSGNLIVLLTENRSPLVSLAPYTPSRSTLFKYSKEGVLQWIRPLESGWISEPGYGTHLITDQNNNILLPAASWETGQRALLRFTPDGQQDKVLYDRQIFRLFCTPENHISAIEATTALDNQGLLLDEDLNILRETPFPGFPVQTFSLPGQPGSYSYTAERVNYAWSDTLIIRFYHDWQLQWEKVIRLGSVYSGGIGNMYDVNPRTGKLLFFANTITSSSESSLMSLSRDGVLSVLPYSSDNNLIRGLRCHKNDQYYLVQTGGVTLFHENGAVLNDQHIENEHITHSFVFKDILFLLTNDAENNWNMSVFDSEGNYRYLLASEDFNYTWLPYTMDSLYNFYSPDMEGQAISFGGPYAAWQWQRGVVSRFSLGSLVSGISTAVAPAEREGITVFPNPCTDLATLSRIPEQITLYDASGTCVRAYIPASNRIDMHGLPTGTYILELREAGGLKITLNVMHTEH